VIVRPPGDDLPRPPEGEHALDALLPGAGAMVALCLMLLLLLVIV
jgi:hypothetical protein